MNNFAEMNIDFYSKNDASVRMSFAEIGDNSLPIELILFCSFLLRQVHNLKNTNLSALISEALLKVNSANVHKFNLGDFIKASDIDVISPLIVPFRGKGEKRFDVVLNIIDMPPDLIPLIKLYPKGFGIFGKEVNFYSLQSINALLKYFSGKYINNPPYLQAFSDASNLCGKEYLTGNVGFGISQGQTVIRILKCLFQK